MSPLSTMDRGHLPSLRPGTLAPQIPACSERAEGQFILHLGIALPLPAAVLGAVGYSLPRYPRWADGAACLNPGARGGSEDG